VSRLKECFWPVTAALVKSATMTASDPKRTLTMRRFFRRFLVSALAIFLFVTGVSAWAETVRDRINTEPDFQVYAVIFGITVPTDTSVPTIRLARVTDPKLGTTEAVQVEVPDEFIHAAIRIIEANHYEPQMKDGESVEFFTYFIYAPSYPDIVIVDIDKPIDQQT